MDVNEFFERVQKVKPQATWNVTTTNVGAQISWEWEVTLDGFKYYDYLIPDAVMKDDDLIKTHLKICAEQIKQK
ncbi:hypothetical protein HA47_03695 [Pantoea stewartii subsp. indologenes]|uniref:hypothetical protein n=1 Tax=Pantoea stewartii TaxID=66269 RepID=UPI00050FE070|nr:hypothetical protein [Pantoea stewartii]KGD84908.1 hypothetical protein HA47_03695 [Pantoea stewartii subsp. indologenes]